MVTNKTYSCGLQVHKLLGLHAQVWTEFQTWVQLHVFLVQGSWVWGFTPHRCSGLKIYFLLVVQDHRFLGFQVSGSYISRK